MSHKQKLSICTEIKEYGLQERFESLRVTPKPTRMAISPLIQERKCPSPPRHRPSPVFCWSHIIQ